MEKISQISAILFDMDGLLADTEPLMCRSAIGALRLQGVEISEGDFYRYWTREGKRIYGFSKEKGLNVDIGAYRKERDRIYGELIKNPGILMPHAYETVEKLSGGYTFAIVSGSQRWGIESILKNAGLAGFFQHIVADDEVKNGKPDPEGFLLGARRVGAAPENCVVVEDAEKGIAAAKNAGMKAIAIPNVHTKDNDFSKADLILGDLSELTSERINSI